MASVPEIVAVALATALAIEAALRLVLGGTVREMARAASKSLRVLRASAISDHWKERVLRRYSAVLLWASVRLFAVIAVVVGLYAAVLTAAGLLLVPAFDPLDALLRPDYAVLAVVVAALYLPARRKVLSGV